MLVAYVRAERALSAPNDRLYRLGRRVARPSSLQSETGV